MTSTMAYAAFKTHAMNALHGHVLDLGAGRGDNAAALPADTMWQGLEPHRRRHARLEQIALRHDRAVAPLCAHAEDIPLPDASVDSVLASVTLCSVDDPRRVLHEIRRVLRPGGTLVFAEHVAAPAGTRARAVQKVVAPVSRLLDHGCDPTRDTESIIRGSGVTVRELRRFELPRMLGAPMPYIVGVAVS